jgi:hypothetical protein
VIDNLVVGSGPIGIAAAHEILAMGQTCAMVYGDLEIEPLKKSVVDELKKVSFVDWGFSEKLSYRRLTSNDSRIKTHVGSKLLFGSSYTYAQYEEFSNDALKVSSDVNFFSSLAIGGLGNVWGSICFPYSTGDNQKLRVPLQRAHYDSMAPYLPLAGDSDGLSDVYQLPSKLLPPVELSNLGRQLFKRFHALEKHRINFDIYGGKPRVAVETIGVKACQSCGLCATGCVWNSIWDAKSTLDSLKNRPGFNVVVPFIVDTIKVNDGHFEVFANDGRSLQARKIFLAAGPVSTAIILQKSSLIPDEIQLDDTQLTILPCLALGTKQTDKNFVLSQFILNFLNPNSTSKYFVQITGYNEDLARRAKSYSKALVFFPNKILDYLFRFVGIAMIFEESNSSGKIIVRKHKGNIHISSLSPSQNKKGAKFSLIKTSLLRLKLVPLGFLSQKVGIGESYHIGNMRGSGGESLMNTKGEVIGVSNLFVIGSASLDHIAPGPITYPAMANTIRIIQEVFAH